ncbi:MAG: hypothetical protein ACE5FA_11345, partial [Dehalococcoidia bacterium]
MAEPGLGLDPRGLNRGDGIDCGLGGRDGAGKRDFGDVVDHSAEPPDAAADRLELTEVGLPDAAAPGWRLQEDGAAGPCQLPPFRLIALGQEEP